MEAPATTGAPSADSPPASTPSTTPATPEEFEAALRGDADSSPHGEGDQDPSTDPDGDKPKGEAEPEEKKATDEDQPKDKTARRIDKLLKDRDALRKEVVETKRQAELTQTKLSLALKKVLGEVTSLKERLSQYEEIGTAEEQLAEIKSRQALQAELSEHERKVSEKFEQEERRLVDEEARGLIEDALAEALESFPHLTDAQLRAKLAAHVEANPDAMVSDAADLFRQLAQQLDEELYSVYEKRALEKHKPKLNAPTPLVGKGTMGVPGKFASVDDMIADAEARFGSTWGSK